MKTRTQETDKIDEREALVQLNAPWEPIAAQLLLPEQRQPAADLLSREYEVIGKSARFCNGRDADSGAIN